jgi:addiction module HigA family antidote
LAQPNTFRRALGVPPRRINEIVMGKRAITADTALRLARYLGNSPGFWMALQASFDLEEAVVVPREAASAKGGVIQGKNSTRSSVSSFDL